MVAEVLAAYPPPPAWVLTGPGDDAAVVEFGADDPQAPSGVVRVVASTDTLVEGSDFRWDLSSPREVGIKLAAQTLADIAAMGARPMALLVSLAAPGELPSALPVELARGLAEECARAGATMIGGDVSASAQVVLTGTALGVLDGGRAAVVRSGARSGDLVALAGRPGCSAAGLDLLLAGVAAGDAAGEPSGREVPERGPEPALEQLMAVHRAPRPPYAAGPRARAAGATALIDTSDGLLRDAARVASASGVVIDLDPARLPRDRRLPVAARRLLGPDQMPDQEPGQVADQVLEWVLTGGEDHALLACFPQDAVLPEEFTVVGRVLPGDHGEPHGPAGVAVLVGGRPWPGRAGWTHW